jgi:voltage-gated potassium channel Kch
MLINLTTAFAAVITADDAASILVTVLSAAIATPLRFNAFASDGSACAYSR